MFTHETKIRVRYAETDQMGYVYYGNFAQYYEVARVESMRSFGLTYKEMEKDGVMMPVLKLVCNYFKPAKYDDLLSIKLCLKKMPGVRIHFYFETYNEENILLNTGEVELVFINTVTKRPTKCPQNLLDKLAPYFIKKNS